MQSTALKKSPTQLKATNNKKTPNTPHPKTVKSTEDTWEQKAESLADTKKDFNHFPAIYLFEICCTIQTVFPGFCKTR